jgi:hypothetical protein
MDEYRLAQIAALKAQEQQRLHSAGKPYSSGRGGAGGGAKYTATKRLSNGQMAYLINGVWYDNPEGH